MISTKFFFTTNAFMIFFIHFELIDPGLAKHPLDRISLLQFVPHFFVNIAYAADNGVSVCFGIVFDDFYLIILNGSFYRSTICKNIDRAERKLLYDRFFAESEHEFFPVADKNKVFCKNLYTLGKIFVYRQVIIIFKNIVDSDCHCFIGV